MLEVKFRNTDYENKKYHIFDDLDLPVTEDEKKRFKKRIVEEYKNDTYWMDDNCDEYSYNEMSDEEKKLDDKKSKDYLNMEVPLTEMRQPHSVEEKSLFAYRRGLDVREEIDGYDFIRHLDESDPEY